MSNVNHTHHTVETNLRKKYSRKSIFDSTDSMMIKIAAVKTCNVVASTTNNDLSRRLRSMCLTKTIQNIDGVKTCFGLETTM